MLRSTDGLVYLIKLSLEINLINSGDSSEDNNIAGKVLEVEVGENYPIALSSESLTNVKKRTEFACPHIPLFYLNKGNIIELYLSSLNSPAIALRKEGSAVQASDSYDTALDLLRDLVASKKPEPRKTI